MFDLMIAIAAVLFGGIYIYWLFGGMFKSKPKQNEPSPKKEDPYRRPFARIDKNTIRKLSNGDFVYELEDMTMVCDSCHKTVKLSDMVNLETRTYHGSYGHHGVCPFCDTANGVVIPLIETLDHALKRNY